MQFLVFVCGPVEGSARSDVRDVRDFALNPLRSSKSDVTKIVARLSSELPKACLKFLQGPSAWFLELHASSILEFGSFGAKELSRSQ